MSKRQALFQASFSRGIQAKIKKKRRKKNERQDFWHFTACRTKLYAADRNPSGRRSSARNRKFLHQ
jgi:hypothetical protein